MEKNATADDDDEEKVAWAAHQILTLNAT